MGKLYKYSFAVIGIVLIFQNCGKDASFNQDSTASVAINAELGTGDETLDIGVISKACRNLPRKNQIINIQFPKPSETCAWEESGNLSTRDAFFRARIEQKQNLGLPRGAIVCDAIFDFKPQPFRYDDYFALLFNKNIITSGYDFSEHLTPQNFGLLSYNWNQLRGVRMEFGSQKEQVVCPQIPGAEAMCSFPGHDTAGVIDLDLDSRYIQAVMSNGVPSDHSFTLVTFGDDDDNDCEHSDVEFDVTVSYVLSE